MVPRRESQNFQAGGQIQSVGGLLESQERAILEEIAGQEMPHSQRASVLLSLDSGASQKEAGERAGMSPRQARYWRDRFVQHRLDIFPQGLLAQIRVGPLTEERALIKKQESEMITTTQEEPENMTDEPRESENQPEELQVATTLVEEQEEAAVEKKNKKAKSKKKEKSKKDKKRKKGKKKKSAKKAGAKKKSAKSKKKRRKK
jgi:outer membrane biosynthesis protein TonB